MRELAIDYKNKEFQVEGKVNAREVMVFGLRDTEIKSTR
jgi:hypothetical protein